MGKAIVIQHFYTVQVSKYYVIVVNWDYVNILCTVIYIVYEVSGVLLLTCECDSAFSHVMVLESLRSSSYMITP